MKAIHAHSGSTYNNVHYNQHQSIILEIKNWIRTQEPNWEFYRFGISATGIFIQVTFGALMIAVLGMAQASPWVFGIGIFFSFMANSIAFAQSPMRIVLGLIILSIVVNLLLTLAYGIPLLIN